MTVRINCDPALKLGEKLGLLTWTIFRLEKDNGIGELVASGDFGRGLAVDAKVPPEHAGKALSIAVRRRTSQR